MKSVKDPNNLVKSGTSIWTSQESKINDDQTYDDQNDTFYFH